jgi:tripartite-type tricarboxylate transporter receptor subunit TctC
MVGGAPYVLVIYPGLPAKTMKELIALAKKQPGKLNFGSAGVTSLAYLATAQFADQVGIKITHVPYKAAAQTVPDMLTGRLEIQFATIAVARPSIDGGKLRALAVTGKERMTIFPTVPTVAEAGLPGYEATLWFALAMPNGTPDAIVSRFNKELTALLKEKETHAALEKLGLTPEPGTPQVVMARIKSEHKRWGEVARRAGIVPKKK